MRVPANFILGVLFVLCSLSCGSFPESTKPASIPPATPPAQPGQSSETQPSAPAVVFEQQISSSLAEAGWTLMDVEDAVLRVVEGKHVIKVRTTPPAPGWKIRLEKKETSGRRVHEFVLIGKPPTQAIRGKPAAVEIDLEAKFDKNVMLVVISGKNGDRTEPVPEIPADASNTPK